MEEGMAAAVVGSMTGDKVGWRLSVWGERAGDVSGPDRCLSSSLRPLGCGFPRQRGQGGLGGGSGEIFSARLPTSLPTLLPTYLSICRLTN